MRLREGPAGITMEIRDNGRGFRAGPGSPADAGATPRRATDCSGCATGRTSSAVRWRSGAAPGSGRSSPCSCRGGEARSGGDWRRSVPEAVLVKVCGLTDPREALACVASGAWAIGLVFAAESPRRVSAETARRVVDALPAEVRKVGVFVDPHAGEVAELVEACHLTDVQVYGGGGST